MKQVVPIYVLGSAHSGTTILYRMLAMHPDVTWFSQYSQRAGQIPGRVRLPLAHLLDRTLRRVFPHDWRKIQTRLRSYVVPLPGEADRIWRALIPEHFTGDNQKAVARIRAVIDEECARMNRSVILVKHPRLMHNLHILRTAHPSARYIHIVRDGRAVACGLRHKFARGLGPGEAALLAAARHWVQVLDQVARWNGLADIMEIRYEDLCKDVHTQLAHVMHRVGLDPARFPFRRLVSHLQTTNELRLTGATADEIAKVEALQRVHLERLGYLSIPSMPTTGA